MASNNFQKSELAAPASKELENPLVATAKVSDAKYDWPDRDNELRAAIENTSKLLNWFDPSRGCYGNVIPKGSKVVIKPNFVLHYNQGTDNLLPLITNGQIIKIIVEEVLKSSPKHVLVGDAPVQGCDFTSLLHSSDLTEWADDLKKRDERFLGVFDFRRTISLFTKGIRIPSEDVRPLDEYVLFNLGEDSLLEDITTHQKLFRVTNYPPELMAKTHSKANHQYLISKYIIDADVVINLPKLKTHKKAGITCALKNLVGINGNKEYLPHHRVGGSANGGDCYPGSSIVKQVIETMKDWQNSTQSRRIMKFLEVFERPFQKFLHLRGDKIGIEGSWSGNQTVPRMTIDLNRIAIYGKSDGTLDTYPQRSLIHVVDAIIAGQGDGPLASEQYPIGRIFAGSNALAVDWVGSHFLSLNPEKVPLLKLGFNDFRWAIARFQAKDIDLVSKPEDQLDRSLVDIAKNSCARLPEGWISAQMS
ncbi:MAG: DUF362 domain-containing protein [Acidobacteria bacterium]|nr:DUF362 domain-containing protein [Acidobacteriota bacterium]